MAEKKEVWTDPYSDCISQSGEVEQILEVIEEQTARERWVGPHMQTPASLRQLGRRQPFPLPGNDSQKFSFSTLFQLLSTSSPPAPLVRAPVPPSSTPDLITAPHHSSGSAAAATALYLNRRRGVPRRHGAAALHSHSGGFRDIGSNAPEAPRAIRAFSK